VSIAAKTVALVGDVDGVNLVFTTPARARYVMDSTILWIQGLPRWRDNDDGFTQTDPDNGIVTLKRAPIPGDDPHLTYQPIEQALSVQVLIGGQEFSVAVSDGAEAVLVEPQELEVVTGGEVAVLVDSGEIIATVGQQ